MDNSSGILDKWREYFRSANSDIFSIIEFAIMVAASDCPFDLKLNRDRIAELLFTCKYTKCFGCDKIELALPNVNGSEKSDDKCKSGMETVGSKSTKESKVNSVEDDDHHQDISKMNVNQVSNYSYDEAEALTNEIEAESLLFDDVLRIKEVLDNNQEESDGVLFDSLRKLQLTPLSVEILKATEIGKSVNALRKHRSKEIRNLVRTLIGDWTSMVDAWVNATAALAETATESVKTSAEEVEEGLPSPPMDEGAFFATPTSMELSQFFDGIDDDENPRINGESNKSRERRGPRTDRPKVPPSSTKDKDDQIIPSKEPSIKQAPTCKPDRPRIGESRAPIQTKPTAPRNVNPQQKPRAAIIQRRPVQPQQQERKTRNDEDSVTTKLEVAKRKLHERYQEAENAKKQKTIQIMELHELPRQNPAKKNQNLKPGNHNRTRPNVRL